MMAPYLRIEVRSKVFDGAINPFELTLDPDPEFRATEFRFGDIDVALYLSSCNKAQIVFDKAIAPLPPTVQRPMHE